MEAQQKARANQKCPPGTAETVTRLQEQLFPELAAYERYRNAAMDLRGVGYPTRSMHDTLDLIFIERGGLHSITLKKQEAA